MMESDIQITKKDLDEIKSIYEENRIVTRNDWPSLNSRPYAKAIYNRLVEDGYSDAVEEEFHLDSYIDYCTAIYDPKRYEKEEVEKYMKDNVLKEF